MNFFKKSSTKISPPKEQLADNRALNEPLLLSGIQEQASGTPAKKYNRGSAVNSHYARRIFSHTKEETEPLLRSPSP